MVNQKDNSSLYKQDPSPISHITDLYANNKSLNDDTNYYVIKFCHPLYVVLSTATVLLENKVRKV